MARPPGKLSIDIVEFINDQNRAGEGPTARDIADALYGDDYTRLIAVHRCLRNLERHGVVKRVPMRHGAEWWRPNAYKGYINALLSRL